MRIISGEYRSRRFSVPKTFNARPTTDFAKENLFNVLSNNYLDFDGLVALDLFSGTGSIALELISRGAALVVAVEKRREHAAFIQACAKKLRCEDRIQIISGDALSYIKRNSSTTFDFIFADPPYIKKGIPEIPSLIQQTGLLKPGGLFTLEHPKEHQFTPADGCIEHRTYGSVHFSFFRFERT